MRGGYGMEQMKQDVFKNTRMSNAKNALIRKYGDSFGFLYYKNAVQILIQEIRTMNDRGNKVIREHLRVSILPGYACYRALINYGISNKEAIALVQEEICNSSKPMGNMMNKVKKIPFIYGIFRIILKPYLKKEYPKEGWKIKWNENSNRKITFDMLTCLYCEELSKRDAKELCQVYCLSDHVSFDPLDPKILFKRSKMLANGDKLCNFCFEKGRKTKEV
jgi:hypothetical protein